MRENEIKSKDVFRI